MFRYINDIISKIQRLDKRLDDINVLTNKHWKEIRDDDRVITVIFTKNENTYRITEKGHVIKGKWEFLGNEKIEIEVDGESKLYKHKFHNDCILLLNLDGTLDFNLYIDEKIFNTSLNTIQKIDNYIEDLARNSLETKKNHTLQILSPGKDEFDPVEYPQIENELDKLKLELIDYPIENQDQILLSYLFNYSIKNEFIISNPKLCKDLTNDRLSITLIEKLLSVSIDNRAFQKNFIEYISKKIKTN